MAIIQAESHLVNTGFFLQ